MINGSTLQQRTGNGNTDLESVNLVILFSYFSTMYDSYTGRMGHWRDSEGNFKAVKCSS